MGGGGGFWVGGGGGVAKSSHGQSELKLQREFRIFFFSDSSGAGGLQGIVSANARSILRPWNMQVEVAA